jgi:hypothetical protein
MLTGQTHNQPAPAHLPDPTHAPSGPHASGPIPPSLSVEWSLTVSTRFHDPQFPIAFPAPASHAPRKSRRCRAAPTQSQHHLLPPHPTCVACCGSFHHGLHHSRTVPPSVMPALLPLTPHWQPCSAPLHHSLDNGVPTARLTHPLACCCRTCHTLLFMATQPPLARTRTCHPSNAIGSHCRHPANLPDNLHLDNQLQLQGLPLALAQSWHAPPGMPT